MTLWTIWTRLVRPVLAMIPASLAAGLVFVLVAFLAGLGEETVRDTAVLWILAAIFIAMFASPCVLVIVLVIRIFRLPRPWSELAAGLVLGPAIFIYFNWESDPTWERLVRTIEVGYWMLFTLPGATGAYVYWLMVGRPTRTAAPGAS